MARALKELILFRWETPDYLLSDNGKEFDNKFVKGTLEEYGVRHVTTPPTTLMQTRWRGVIER